MSREFWQSGDAEKCIAILKTHREIVPALEEISVALDRTITRPAIERRFRTDGLGTACSYLKRGFEKKVESDHRSEAAPILGPGTKDIVFTMPAASPAPEPPPPAPKSAAKIELHPVEAREARDETSRLRRHVDQLVEELRQARARQVVLDAFDAHRATPRILTREKSSGLREMAAVVLASDWHVEEEVTPESIAYLNKYTLEIAAGRIKRFFDAIIWQIEHHRASERIAIRDLVLWIGGDIMSGRIHPELIETGALSPIETIIWVLPLLRDGIATLLDRLNLERIEVPCSYGNHGRTGEKKMITTGYANSFEWLMYHSLASDFRADPRVHFEITSSAHQYVEVFGKTLHFHHGDELRYNGGVGGLGIPLLKRVPVWDAIRPADVHHIGHFHQFRDYGRCIVNGSLIGYNAYAQSIGAAPEPPQQAFYLLDSKRGKCNVTPLWTAEHEEKIARAS